jgi:hypothetical protein
MLNRIGLAVATALLTTTAAWAGPQFESVRATCGVINCSGMTLRGIHQNSEPFIIQVYARAGECLRLDVSEQTADLVMAVLAPSVNFGAVVDDRDVGDFRPLVFVDPVPQTGWYTVAISYWEYDTVVARFELEYGRYPGGNENCVAPPAAANAQLPLLGSPTAKPMGAKVGTDVGARQED